MRKLISFLLLMIVLPLTLFGCGQGPSPTASPEVALPTLVPPTIASPTSTSTPAPQGETIIVTSTADSGPGTLRQALLDAQPNDILTFDPSVFPPVSPATIYISSELPGISLGYLTIDASNAGVILDGSKIPEGWNSGIGVYSNGNTIRGLQVLGFSGAGIVIGSGQDNLIENNISCGNDYGIGLWGTETSGNTITGNYLGIQPDEVTAQGNKSAGITIMEGANHNFIGPDNHIAYNGNHGIEIINTNTVGNTITQNSLHDNGMGSISLSDGGNTNLTAPTIFDFDLNGGTLAGIACAGCTIEIFSDSNASGRIFEGQTTVDINGTFAFDKNAHFDGPNLTAIVTDRDGNTSQFSDPTSGTQAIRGT